MKKRMKVPCMQQHVVDLASFVVYLLKPFVFLVVDEDSESSSSDVDVKKGGRRHKLLRHKLSLSEDESGEEKAASKEKKKGGKKKSGQKGWFLLSFCPVYWVFFFNGNVHSQPKSYFLCLIFVLPPVGSDDSEDSDFEKDDSSAESGISEELSESEKDGKRRKTRWGNASSSSGDVFTVGRFGWISCILFFLICISVCRAAQKKDDEKQRSYKQKKKRRRIKVQESSSSNEKVFKMQSTRLSLKLSKSSSFSMIAFARWRRWTHIAFTFQVMHDT